MKEIVTFPVGDAEYGAAWMAFTSAFNSLWATAPDAPTRSLKGDISRALVITFAIRMWAHRHGLDDESREGFERLVEANWRSTIADGEKRSLQAMWDADSKDLA